MLRTRLVAILSALMLAGLAASGAATYRALQDFLLHRIDTQLHAAAAPIGRALGEPSHLGFPQTQSPAGDLPLSTYGEIRSLDGDTIARGTVGIIGRKTYRPELPRSIDPGASGTIFEAGAVGDASYRFRVLAEPADLPFGPSDGVLIVAIPLTEVGQTLHHLLWIEAVVAVLVLATLAGAALWMVRRELRPLEAMGDTASSIAGGDLTRRVEPAGETTEVGRLGLALNGMLAQIETSMEARKASEERLRRFLADASHELRTPLTSIRGYAELFRRGADKRPEDLAVAMRRIEEEAARMGVLVDDLLLLARADETRAAASEEVDLAALLRDAAADARAAAPRRPITVEAPASLAVTGDEGRLRQAIANLVGNALVHTPSVAAVDLRLAARGDWAELTVADGGPGLEPGALEHVFERFWRGTAGGEGKPGGAGLGLPIVAAIAQTHGGDVSAANAPGGGAVFTLRLPRARTQSRSGPGILL